MQLNNLNPQMEGMNTNIIEFINVQKAFMSKIENRKNKGKIKKNVAKFEKLLSILLVGCEGEVFPEFAK